LLNRTIYRLSSRFLFKCSRKTKPNSLSNLSEIFCINIIQNATVSIFLCIFGAEKMDNKLLTFYKNNFRLFSLNALRILPNHNKKSLNKKSFRHNKVIKINKMMSKMKTLLKTKNKKSKLKSTNLIQMWCYKLQNKRNKVKNYMKLKKRMSSMRRHQKHKKNSRNRKLSFRKVNFDYISFKTIYLKILL
jgi:hypothetical protein